MVAHIIVPSDVVWLLVLIGLWIHRPTIDVGLPAQNKLACSMSMLPDAVVNLISAQVELLPNLLMYVLGLDLFYPQRLVE